MAVERLDSEWIAASQGRQVGQQRQEQEGPQETEVCESLSMCGAEAGTRTPMSIRSLRPERGCLVSQVVVMLRFQ